MRISLIIITEYVAISKAILIFHSENLRWFWLLSGHFAEKWPSCRRVRRAKLRVKVWP